jgi:hypothetical protein
VDLGETTFQAAQEKCTKLHALTAEQNAKYHSNQQTASQFTAKIATEKENQHTNSRELTVIKN